MSQVYHVKGPAITANSICKMAIIGFRRLFLPLIDLYCVCDTQQLHLQLELLVVEQIDPIPPVKYGGRRTSHTLILFLPMALPHFL